VRFFTVLRGGQPTDRTDAIYRTVASFPGTSAPGHIYVSIQVRAGTDNDGPDPADTVYFGITQGDRGVGAFLLAIPPEPSSTPPVSGSVPHDPQFPRPNDRTSIGLWQRAQQSPPCPDGGAIPCWVPQSAVLTPDASVSNAPWLLNVATWLGSPGASWAITFEVDTNQIPVGNGAQLFLGSGISEAADGGADAGHTFVWLTNADQVSPDAGGIGGTIVPQDPSSWPQLAQQVGQACGPGVAIYGSTIGVLVDGGLVGSDGGSNPIATLFGSTNTFRVEVRNVPPALATAPFSIRARLRVSDWGVPLGDPAAVWDPCGMPMDVFTMDRSAFTPDAGWNWSFDGGTVDIDYTCSVADGGAFCPTPSNAGTQQRQILLADIGIDQPAGVASDASIQYAQAYRDVYYSPPPGVVTAIPIVRQPPPCGCLVVGGAGWSVAALGATGLGAGVLALRGLRRRRSTSAKR
jgi:hypothetical protein